MSKNNAQRGNRAKHWLVCAFLAVGCLAMAVGLSACGEEFTLIIEDGTSETQVNVTEGEKVEKILEEAQITLGENDEVSLEMDYKVTLDDTAITIARWASVTVIDEDDTYEVGMAGGTVQDALDEAGVTPGENDVVDQDPDAYLTDGMVITVSRAYTEEYVETEEIEYETRHEDSSDLYVGETEVGQEGENGEKEITYEILYDAEGNEISREQVSEVVTKEPVDEIILDGTKVKQQTQSTKKSSSSGSSSKTYNGKKIVNTETVYDCDGSGHGYYIYTLEDGSTAYVDF